MTLRARATGTPVSVAERHPRSVAFAPPRPNPFQGLVGLAFDLPRDALVSLEALDLSGRRVATIVAGAQAAGRHELRWRPADGRGAPLEPGLYFLRFRAAGFTGVRRIVLLP